MSARVRFAACAHLANTPSFPKARKVATSMMPDSRDRLIALEVKVQYQSSQLDEQREALQELTTEVRKISNILEQAKGAKWILASLWLGFGGVVGVFLGKAFGLLGLKI